MCVPEKSSSDNANTNAICNTSAKLEANFSGVTANVNFVNLCDEMLSKIEKFDDSEQFEFGDIIC
ncbi:15030_t:CDS:2 [Cetraspora pellucida]|uniref:15030_t:CDS:1 n=1 Tax=Cetraspora pellucida TaxID=1433469 RepID=A0ACA9K3G5_9GLOM|nr:15030_t:CDS:2 [Cetraspora pellucida]